jgi:hypothetical protein
MPPSLLQYAFELRALLVEAMEEECSPILDVVGDVSKVPLAEVSTTSSSFDGTSVGATCDDTESKAKDAIVMDLRGAMTLGPLQLLWAVSSNWNLCTILLRVLHVS